MKTIYILWLRQLKRYVRSKARMIGSLGQPVLFLLALGFGFGPIYSKAGGGNYIQFLAPGVIGMGILFTAVFGGIEVIWDRQFGFLKETMVAPVSRAAIMVGRTLGGGTVATIQGVVVFLLALIPGFRPHSLIMLPLALLFMLLTAVFFTALGTIIAARMQDMQGFPLIMNFVMMPLFFLSGALFPLKGLSPTVELIARLDPFSYGVDGIRYALTGAGHFSPLLDVGVLSTLIVICFFVGSRLFQKMEA